MLHQFMQRSCLIKDCNRYNIMKNVIFKKKVKKNPSSGEKKLRNLYVKKRYVSLTQG